METTNSTTVISYDNCHDTFMGLPCKGPSQSQEFFTIMGGPSEPIGWDRWVMDRPWIFPDPKVYFSHVVDEEYDDPRDYYDSY